MVKASIVITNYNYGRFLNAAIDSALGQTYAQTEVVVVDDGSTDGSPHLISAYGERITPVQTGHGGQAAAFNAGFRASRGDVVCFLDADDILLPGAIEDAVVHSADSRVTKVHWLLSGIDEAGTPTGEIIPERALPEGDLREDLLAKGPGGYVWSPTSGNAWSRWFLESVFPMPEDEYVTCADTYLSLWAPLLGPIKAVAKVNALYREHGNNNRYRISEEHITRFVHHSRKVLSEYISTAGIAVDTEAWRDAFRWPDRDQAMGELAGLLSSDERFILIDNGQLGDHFGLRQRAIRFCGTDAGSAPLETEAAVAAELERFRKGGAALLVVAWPAFDWLASHAPFQRYVKERFACVMSNQRLVVFDVRSTPGLRVPS